MKHTSDLLLWKVWQMDVEERRGMVFGHEIQDALAYLLVVAGWNRRFLRAVVA